MKGVDWKSPELPAMELLKMNVFPFDDVVISKPVSVVPVPVIVPEAVPKKTVVVVMSYVVSAWAAMPDEMSRKVKARESSLIVRRIKGPFYSNRELVKCG